MQGVRRLVLAVAMVAVLLPGPSRAAAFAPSHLTVDALPNPVGVGPDDVQFGWQGPSVAVVRVWLGAALVWTSGPVTSPASYTGPPLGASSVYTWSASGSAPARFETGLRTFAAEWVRRTTNEVPQYTFLRGVIEVGRSPIVRARAYVAADQQYELYVNGVLAGKGQAYGYPDAQFYETLPLSLVAGGANAIGIVYMSAGATKGHPAGVPGAIAQISVVHQDGSVERFGTSAAWRVTAGNWLPGTQRDEEGDQVDYTENIDGLLYPKGWDRPGFDDHLWAHPVVLPPRPMVSARTRVVYTPVRPRSVRRLITGAVVADFGQVYAAIPSVTFRDGLPGRLVTMRAGYLLDPGGAVSVLHGTQHTDMSYSYVEPLGPSTFRPFDYLGFRYLQIDDPGALPDVVALARHTLVTGDQASFSSASPVVNAIWELGRHSALYSAQEYFVDTPTREKGPWLWDGFNSSQTLMAAFGDQNLTRASLLAFAQSQARYWPASGRINKIYPTGLGAQDINEFSEIYAEWVWQYWLDTGDRALLATVYPTLVRLSEYVQRAIVPATGLVTNLPATNVYYPFPVVTRLNILGLNVFRRAADVASVLGMPSSLGGPSAALLAAINHRLRLPNGLYVDGLQADGAQAGVSQAANIAALAYGVVPPALIPVVGGYVAGMGMAVPPRIAGELLAALRAAGRDIVPLLTNARIDGWANILARGATFTWEVWQPSDSNGDSMSHGWGSNVLVEIDRTLLGVTPTGGGYATFDVRRPASTLAWTSGTIPTPHGAITVRWQGSRLSLSVPAGTVASVGGLDLGPGDHVVSGLDLGPGDHVVDEAVQH